MRNKHETRFFVKAEEWREFQRFRSWKRALEDSAINLEDNWDSHSRYLQEEFDISDDDLKDMRDQVLHVCDVVSDIVHAKQNTSYKPLRCRVAEVILTEIDGPPF